MRSLPALALLSAFVLAGCSVSSLWPFGSKDTELSRTPANATEYKCDEGKSFWVRSLPDKAVWLIAPDREIRLEQRAGESSYGAGRILLELSGDTATLFDPPASYGGCKRFQKPKGETP
jgi:hypothetical protein